MKIGIPCMKCSLNPSTQINSRTGKASKTCGVGSAWREMNDERLGRDTTIDRALTERNVWMIGQTTDDVPAMVQDEIDRVNRERNENGLRALRKDAVSVIEIVEKPPIDFMQNKTYEERVQFLWDSHDVMSDLIHEWNPNWKIIEAVQHHDEFGGLSAHNHTLVMLSSEDEKGIATMRAKSEFNLKFFNHINSNYAAMMREKGYEVEDCKTYDRLSEEEKLERLLNPKQHGVDAYKYKQQKLEEMDEKIIRLEEKTTSLEAKMDAAKDELEKTVLAITEAPSLDAYKTVLSENNDLKTALSAKDRIIQRLQEEKESIRQTMEKWREQALAWRERFSDIAHKAGAKLMAAMGYDVSSDATINPYPEKQLSSEFDDMKNSVRIDPKQLRIIPDPDQDGRFRIAYKSDSGEYETLQGGFESRDDARDWQRSYEVGTEALNNELQHGMAID